MVGLGRQRGDELLAAVEPEPQLCCRRRALRIDEDVALHRPAREVHRTDMRPRQRVGVVVPPTRAMSEAPETPANMSPSQKATPPNISSR